MNSFKNNHLIKDISHVPVSLFYFKIIKINTIKSHDYIKLQTNLDFLIIKFINLYKIVLILLILNLNIYFKIIY